MAEKAKSNPKNQKFSLEEYQKFKTKKSKQRFQWGYPKLVTLILAVPFIFLLILIISYLIYIRTL